MLIQALLEPEVQTQELEAGATSIEAPNNSATVAESSPHFVPILTLAVVARCAVLAIVIAEGPRTWLYKQSLELTALAQSLLLGHGLSSPFGGSTGPSAFLAPGYPAVVAAVFWIFGSNTTASAIAIMLFQVLLNVTTVFALMFVARRAFGARAANIAGTIWAISPVLLWLPIVFWESSLSTLALITMVAFAQRTAERSTIPRWLAIGLCSGLALLVNPALALVLAAILAWTAWQTKAATRSGPIVAAILCLLVFSPWPIRNQRALHAFVPFRTNMGYELWQGNRPESKGFFDESLHPNKNQIEFNRYATLGELRYMREKSQLAESAIRANPTRFIRLTLKRIGSFWTGLGGEAYSSPEVTHLLLTTLLGTIGLVLLFRRSRQTALLLGLPLLLFPLPYYLTHPDPRFRLVLDPIATILTAYAIVTVYNHFRASRRLVLN